VIVLVARYRAKPGRGDAVAEALREVITASRAEPGNRLYTVQRSVEDPDEFVLYEGYDDEAAVDAHRASPHFQEVVAGRVIPMLESRQFGLYTPVEP
jgi:(4S)-4-hydroxy-5-phosphonooxypentane-2,3-dione isomerase